MPNFKKLYSDTNALYKSPYDGRDYHFNDLILAGSVKTPTNYESDKTPFIYNQGRSSMCASCSYNIIRYMQEVSDSNSGIEEPFSTVFNYANRPETENFEGMYLRTVCKRGRDGSVPYSVLPGFFNLQTCKAKLKRDKDKLFSMAKPFAISSFYQVSSREQIKVAIYTLKGVIAGIYVTDEFYNPVNKEYVIYNPNNPRNYGGHAIAVVGYKEDKDGKFWWRVQNSWGKEYGNNGRIWLSGDYPFIESPYAIVDNIDELKWKEYKKKYMSSNQ